MILCPNRPPESERVCSGICKVQKEIPFSEIESLFKSGYRERTRCRQLRSILKKYRDVSSNKEELQKECKHSVNPVRTQS